MCVFRFVFVFLAGLIWFGCLCVLCLFNVMCYVEVVVNVALFVVAIVWRVVCCVLDFVAISVSVVYIGDLLCNFV